MQTMEFFSDPGCQRLALTLLHFLWQGLVVAALVVVLVRLLKLRPGPQRHTAYLLAMVTMAACPVATFYLVESPAPASGEGIGAGASAFDVPMATHVPENGSLPGPTEGAERGQVPAGSTRSTPARYLSAGLPWVAAAWLVGVLALSVRLLMGVAGMYRWRRRLESLPADLAGAVAALGERMGLAGFVRVFVSRRVAGPMVVGYLRPMVLLPAAMLTNLPPEMLEAIIAHELAHIRRLDLWVNLFQRVTETLLFYHPAVWWLSGRLRNERELCCDELAVAATGERLAYASALEQAYSGALDARQPVLAAGFGGGRRNVLGRVRHVLGSATSPGHSRWWLAGVLVLLSVIAIGVGLGISRLTEKTTPDTDPGPSGPTATAYLEVSPPDLPQAGSGGSSAEEFNRRIATFVVLGTGASVMEKAVTSEDIKQTAWYRQSPDDAAARLAAAIRVASIPETGLIQIRMSGAAPDDLAVIVNTVAGMLVDSAKEQARQGLFDQINERKKKTLEIRNELQVISREMKALRRPEARDLKRILYMITEQLGEIALQKEAIALSHQQITQELEAFKKLEQEGLLDANAEVPHDFNRDPNLQTQIQQEVAVAATAEAYRQKYGLGHPIYQKLKIRLASLRKQIAERKAIVRDATQSYLKNGLTRQLEKIQAQMASVQRKITEAQGRARELQDTMAVLEAKSTRRRFLQERLDTVERRRVELTLRRRLADPIRIVQRAVVPE